MALRPGARWSEALRGTNGIGTALADGRPVAVHGAEHFLARNGFLSCCAAPVFGPDGAVRGVVDVSGDQRAWAARSLSHALGLATLAARISYPIRKNQDIFLTADTSRSSGFPSKSVKNSFGLGWDYHINDNLTFTLNAGRVQYRDEANESLNYGANQLNAQFSWHF